ncbi:MAG: hypothetical protein M3096_06865 [Actinomycetia bacterium]|nr:hypothetical protein [Actinomycetes bacterium]
MGITNRIIAEEELGRTMSVERNTDDFDATFRPRGTWALVLMFGVLLFVLWMSVYLILLSKGVNT